MKKYLPQSLGFTLIELLVVIAIIAVLAVMGFAAYTGLTNRGNDARRVADMKAFADAMEVKRGTSANYSTNALAATDFSTGAFPVEPVTGRAAKYCYQDSTTTPVANPSVANWGTLNAAGCPTAPGTWVTANGVGPSVTAGALYFKFCTINEANQGAGGAVICQGSRQ